MEALRFPLCSAPLDPVYGRLRDAQVRGDPGLGLARRQARQYLPIAGPGLGPPHVWGWQAACAVFLSAV